MTARYYVTTTITALPLMFLIAGFKYGMIAGYILGIASIVGLIYSGYTLGLRDK